MTLNTRGLLSMATPEAQPESHSEDIHTQSRERRKRMATPLRIALLLVALGAGVGVWRLGCYSSPTSKGLQALQIAYRTARPLEARIGGFAYAPFVSLRGTSVPDDGALAQAERLLFEVADDGPSPESKHALGCYYLVERKYNQAINEFKAALQTAEQGAPLHNDLGAALFEKGRSEAAGAEDGQKAEAFAESLTHLNRAITLDPNFTEAIFNRALLRQQMMLLDLAVEDWRAYLEKDSSSLWADEARLHLDRLEQSRRIIDQSQRNLVDEFLNACRTKNAEQAWLLFSPNRERLTTELLNAHLESGGRPQTGRTSEALAALAYAGKLDAMRVGDHFATDLARFYRVASPGKVAAARQAWEMMRQAQKYYGMAWAEKAAELRNRGRQIFLRIGDVCGANLATYWLALHYWEMGRTRESRSLYDSLLLSSKANKHEWLRGRALYQQASLAYKFDEHSNAITYYEEAEVLADKVNDSQCHVDSTGGLIEKYRLLGNRPECFMQIVKGWSLLGSPSLGPMPLWRHYNFLAMAFAAFGFRDAAIDCARESLRFAAAANNYTTLSYSYAHLGLMYGKVQDFEQAFGNVGRAYDLASSHADKAFGQVMMAYAALQMGHLHQQREEFAEALRQYDHTVELHSRYAIDFSTHLYQAYKGRLACYTALNDTSAAKHQLATLLELMNKHRAKILEEENRDNFFDAEQSVYDLGIDLAYSRMQDRELSFAYAEASRARSLLDSISAGAQVVKRGDKFDLLLQAAAQPLPLAQIQAHIPDGARLIQYAVLDDKLLIWVVSRDGAQAISMPLSQAALTDLVNRFLGVLRGAREAELAEMGRLARELFDQLISPVEGLLGGCRMLIIAPDKILNRLPWDALISPASNQFLLESYMVIFTPSATLFALCSDLAMQKADARSEHVLSIGDPDFDRNAYPGLDPLAGAEDEAIKIADLYSSSSLLVGPEAGESAVRGELARADVAHFAGHCLVKGRSALHSSLVLAKQKGFGADDGLLQAHEIYGLKLPRMRLAVLSACQTGVEHYYRGEGMIGLARAFLGARVPVVVASLWAVDSDATAELMIEFHRHRKSGRVPTVEALWHAKRSLLQKAHYSHPMYWAAFQVIGGHATF